MNGTKVRSGHELLIGLVGAIGVDLDRVTAKLEIALDLVDYKIRKIVLIQPILGMHPKWPCATQEHEQLCHLKMDIGNDLRRWTERKDILAAVAIAQIRKARVARWQADSQGQEDESLANQPIERCAYVLKSLKTPEEIKRLRSVYGDNFFAVAAYASAASRKAWLAERIAASHSETNSAKFESIAAQLMERDERESGEDLGQNVQNTFCMADVFIDADHEQDMAKQIERFIQLLFSHPFRTPTRAEFGMFQAFGAARCSSSAGRQVGSALTNRGGDLLAVGVNEVAKAQGGQYDEGDKLDGRDHVRRTDSNAEMNRHVLEDLLARLKCKGWLSEKLSENDVAGLAQKMKREGLLDAFPRDDPEAAKMPSLLKTARILHGIEFIRAVHAEMAALMSLLRCGVSAKGCTMYVTTFPCHECAKHIVASGIESVVFIEPYPKSRVSDLFSDSIVVDDAESKDKLRFKPFVGIAPRRYLDLFEAPQRTSGDGSWLEWDSIRKSQEPRLGGQIETYVGKEREFVAQLNLALKLLYDSSKITTVI